MQISWRNGFHMSEKYLSVLVLSQVTTFLPWWNTCVDDSTSDFSTGLKGLFKSQLKQSHVEILKFLILLQGVWFVYWQGHLQYLEIIWVNIVMVFDGLMDRL